MSSSSYSLLWSQLVLPSLALFGLAVSLLGIGVGLGLLFRKAATLRFFETMNRWTSTRQALRPLEIPRNVDASAARRPRWNGVVLALAGAYVAIALSQLSGAKVAGSLALAARYASLAEMAVNTIRWLMVLGGLAAVAIGIMLLFFPQALRGVEERANRWYSTRQALSGGDAMRMGLDRWVAIFPRASGTLIACLSLVSTVAFALLVLGRL
jgi:hypothetical protein